MIASRILEVIRFAATGVASVGLNLLIVMFLTERLGLHYLASITVCFVAVTLVSFWMNRVWTFRKRLAGTTTDLRRYACMALACLLLSLALSSACVEFLGMPYPVATVLLSLVFAPLTYLAHRRWSFGLRWLSDKGSTLS